MANAAEAQELYENMFAHRFTAEDLEYQEYLKRKEDQPPIVENWHLGNQRNSDRYRGNRHHGGWEGRRNWSNNSYNQPPAERGWGNYQQNRQDRSHYSQGGDYTHNRSYPRSQPHRY